MGCFDFLTNSPPITIEVGEFKTQSTNDGIGVKLPAQAVIGDLISELPYGDGLIEIFIERFKNQYEGHPDKFEQDKLIPLFKKCLDVLNEEVKK